MKTKPFHHVISGVFFSLALASCSQTRDAPGAPGPLSAPASGPSSGPTSGTPPVPSAEKNTPSANTDQSSPTNEKTAGIPINQAVLSQVPPHLKNLVTALVANETMTKFSPQAFLILAKGAKSEFISDGELSGYDGKRLFSELLPSSKEASNKVIDVERNYKAIQHPYSFGNEQIARNNLLFNETLKASPSSATDGIGPTPALTLGMISVSSNHAFSSILKSFDDAAMNISRNFLAQKLQQIPQGDWSEWDRISNLAPNEARALAAKKTAEWILAVPDRTHQGNPKMLEATLQGYLTKAVIREVEKKQSLRELAGKPVAGTQIESSRQLTAIGETLIDYSGEVQNRIEEIKAKQEEINISLEKIKNDMGSIDQGIAETGQGVLNIDQDFGFLHEFMFGRMDSGEQINALKDSISADTGDQQLHHLNEKIRLVEQKQNVESLLLQLANGAQSLMECGIRHGVDPTMLKNAQTGIRLGDLTTQILTPVLKSGYFGTTKAAIDLLGGFVPEIARQRRELIIAHLPVSDSMRLKDFAETVLEHETEILSRERLLLKDFEILSTTIQKKHEEIMDRLDMIQGDLQINREITLAIANEKIEKCANFLTDRNKTENFNPSNKLFKRFDMLQRFFSGVFAEFNDCNSGLETTFKETEGAFASKSSEDACFLFSYEANQKTNNGYDSFLKRTYLPSLAYFESRTKANPLAENFGLALPGMHSANLHEKVSEIRLSGNNLALPYKLDHLAKPIIPGELNRRIQFLLELYPNYELIDFQNGGKLGDLSSILTDQNRFGMNAKTSNLLMDALSKINQAIAQESILAGDQSLRYLYHDVFAQTPGAACEDSRNLTLPICIVQNNPLLARNFVLYGIREDLKQNGYNAIGYEIARNHEIDASLLQNATKKPWNFVRTGGKWSVRIGTRDIPLPTGQEISLDEIAYRPEMIQLINLKEKLIHALTDYHLREMNDSNRNNLYQILLDLV